MAAALGHVGVRFVAGGWAAFITENLVLSSNRDWLVGQFGESGYRTGCETGLSSGKPPKQNFPALSPL